LGQPYLLTPVATDIKCECSVAFDPHSQLWFLLSEGWDPPDGSDRDLIRLQYAQFPWGPFQDGGMAFDGGQRDRAWYDSLFESGGGNYAPYLIPRWFTATGDKTTIFYTMSTWRPYQTVLMKTVVQVQCG
jgi:hypothetical protein